MKALILNSGLGSRMGVLTSEHPKCMTEISPRETILSRQLKQLADAGIREVVITTGLFRDALIAYCESLDLPLSFTFVHNPEFRETNYIYSIYCAREALDDDLLLMHGDLVFENEVLDRLLACETSCMAVSSTLPLPEKDTLIETQGEWNEKGYWSVPYLEEEVAGPDLRLLRGGEPQGLCRKRPERAGRGGGNISPGRGGPALR